MSSADDVPAPIRAFVEATNAADSAAFVAVFTEDALLSDWGKEFRGHEAIAGWNDSDNIGRQAHFEVLGVKPGTTQQEVVATVMVTGGGFNGTSDLSFTLRGDMISHLVIEP